MSSDTVLLAKKLAAYKALNSPQKCGSSYEKLLNIQVAHLTATYTVASVLHYPGTGLGYTAGEVVMLLDNGHPSAQVLYDGANWTLVNSPIYTTIPNTTTLYEAVTITSTNNLTPIGVGAKFALNGPKSLSCYGCLNQIA